MKLIVNVKIEVDSPHPNCTPKSLCETLKDGIENLQHYSDYKVLDWTLEEVNPERNYRTL